MNWPVPVDKSLVAARAKSALLSAIAATPATALVWMCLLPFIPREALAQAVLYLLFIVMPLSFASLWIVGIALPPGRRRLMRAPLVIFPFGVLIASVPMWFQGHVYLSVGTFWSNLFPPAALFTAMLYGGLLLTELIATLRRWRGRQTTS